MVDTNHNMEHFKEPAEVAAILTYESRGYLGAKVNVFKMLGLCMTRFEIDATDQLLRDHEGFELWREGVLVELYRILIHEPSRN